MTRFFDKKGREIKPDQLLKVYHFTGPGSKHNYMYKQVTILDGELYALHLPIKPRDEPSGYRLNASGRIVHLKDNKRVISGVEIIQCHCDQCVSGKDCK